MRVNYIHSRFCPSEAKSNRQLFGLLLYCIDGPCTVTLYIPIITIMDLLIINKLEISHHTMHRLLPPRFLNHNIVTSLLTQTPEWVFSAQLFQNPVSVAD